MTKWEYKFVTHMGFETNEEIDQFLNKLGAEGWECFHIYGAEWFFKRPAPNPYVDLGPM